jgi:primosomal protein N' (replication factor Y)
LERITYFADVLLPLPLPGTFTYRVPYALNEFVKEGIRVVVQFGARKVYTALLLRLHENPPEKHVPKYILSILDEEPIVSAIQLKFWEWLSRYYLCFPGEVMNAGLPSALKLASETKIAVNPDAPSGASDGLNEKELLLLEALQHRKIIPISEISKILDQQKTIPVIRNLLDRRLIISEEELNDPYKPRIEDFVRLSDQYSLNEPALRSTFDQLEKKAKKQLSMLMSYLHLSRYGLENSRLVTRKELVKESEGSGAHLAGLVEKGVLEIYQKIVSRLDPGIPEQAAGPLELSPIQLQALEKVRIQFEEKKVVLLHGVTASGKTELYIRLMQEEIDKGRQVLFLLPEIALTTQIIQRLRRHFGARVGVYHSRFNVHEKVDIYKAVLQNPAPDSVNRFDIILGARSAIFLPFSNLGLIVVDEEHDPSYKQMDPAPRYNGRDAAIYLAGLHQARVLLGSATPSVETYYNVERGKYGMVELLERYAGVEMPDIAVVDTREAARQGQMKSHFSAMLIDYLKAMLAMNEQAILFQNRRGFSLRLECDHCHWMPMCRNCDVTLVYHKQINQLRCHYCGYISGVPEKCPDCQGLQVKMKGFGTEKVEEELGLIVPGARIARMDLDTTKTKHALHQIISDFEAQKIDILVGTQMVTKGLDFDHVSLVCILNADNMLSYPDFRSAERSYQLMAQVSGRSGRKNKQGKVIIQTRQPNHTIIRQVVENNYNAMFNQQLAERMKFGYPPFTRLIMLKLKHRESDFLNKAALHLATELRLTFGNLILGPEYPMVSRIMNLYIKQILFKIGNGLNLAEAKEQMMAIIDKFQKDISYRSVRIIIDVDPQ